MSITFQYGPAAGAIGLAQKAGQGAKQREAFNQDISFANLMQQQQDAVDRKNANAIQTALGVDEFNAHTTANDRQFAAQQQQQSVNNDYRAEEAKARDQELAANRAIAQQNANTTARNADTMANYRTTESGLNTQKYQERESALNTLDPNQANMIRANGHLPSAGQDGTAALSQQYRLLLDEARRVQKDKDASSFNENDLKQLQAGASQSAKIPGAIAGMEDRYLAAHARLQAISDRIKATEEKLQNPSASTFGNAVDPNLGKQVLQQQQQNTQQSASAQQPRIIETATNPNTGEKVGFDANTGRWVKLTQ